LINRFCIPLIDAETIAHIYITIGDVFRVIVFTWDETFLLNVGRF